VTSSVVCMTCVAMLTRAPSARALRTQLPHLALARALPRARTRRDAKCDPGCACSNVNCPANSNSPVGSSDSSACVCNAGYFGDAKAGCTKCPAGSYCPGGAEKKACPAMSSSDRGSSKLIECVCNVGYMGTGVEGCTVCPVDSYCPGGGKVFQCTDNANANAGSAKCTCRDGWSEKNDGTCIRCPMDFYCPPELDHQPMQCPANTESPPGSIAPHNCKCLAGFENAAYEVASNFFKVSSGDFAQVRDRCKQGGGEIASINTIREQIAALQVCSKCWIALAKGSPGSPWENLDNHPVDFTAWALGKPDTANGALNVIYDSNGNTQSAQWDDFPASAKFEGLCKKAAVPPTCTQISTPLLLGLNPGFITDFYYVGKDMSDFPYDVVATSVPNSESIADQIPFYDDEQFNKLDKNAPHDRFAGTWTGMLEVEDGGTYTFTTESDDGSHVYVDGKMVVDNGGTHPATLRSGTIGLTPGYHIIKLDFFENGGGASMVAKYKGPDTNDKFTVRVHMEMHAQKHTYACRRRRHGGARAHTHTTHRPFKELTGSAPTSHFLTQPRWA
jgi:hypothetical protein